MTALPDHPDHLRRSLSNRHLQLIAIGGAIGTGLFMGSGKTISLAGPSILLVYLIIGVMLFFVMRAMGELLLSNLEYKSFIDFSTDLLGPWAGFFCGWTYWFCWIITAIADVIAIAAYAQYWFPGLAPWIPAVLCVLLLLTLNLTTVKLFGEMEFWFALIKIIAICALIVTGFALVAWGFTSPSGHQASVANLWNDGGFFPKGLSGFFAGFQIAVFAFVGIELVGTTAAETADPERDLPKAINSIPVRIIIFYVLALVAIMIVTPWRLVEPGKSPFVELFVLAGIPAAASLINFVVLTSATSSANSGIFSTSRMLYGLAGEQHAPKTFGRLSRAAVPSLGLLFSCFCLLLGAALIYLIPDLITAFTLITTLSAVLFMFVWSLILFSYIAYRRKRPQLHEASIYKMPGGVFMCWVCLAFFVFVLVLLSLRSDTREALIASPVWFVALLLAYKGFFGNLARGDLGLAKTYWLYGVLVGMIVSAVSLIITSASAILIITLLYTVYEIPVLLGTWRAASRYKGSSIWSILAKVSVVLGIIGLSINLLSTVSLFHGTY